MDNCSVPRSLSLLLLLLVVVVAVVVLVPKDQLKTWQSKGSISGPILKQKWCKVAINYNWSRWCWCQERMYLNDSQLCVSCMHVSHLCSVKKLNSVQMPEEAFFNLINTQLDWKNKGIIGFSRSIYSIA